VSLCIGYVIVLINFVRILPINCLVNYVVYSCTMLVNKYGLRFAKTVQKELEV